MKELTFSQIENGKNNLIKLNNDLIERFKKNDTRKKADRDYYEYEENKFHGLKDVRNLFNQNDDYDDNYEGIEYLFDEEIMYYSFKNNGLEYKEIKKLLSGKPKKELIECVIDYEEINCFELVNDEKVEYCTITEDQKVESYELIEEKYAEIIECELIEDQKVKKIECEAIIEDQKVEYCIIIEDQKVESYELIEEKYVEVIESCELIEDKEDNNQLIRDKTVENDVHQLIESCELIEDQEDINELIFNKPVEITFNESPFKSLISDIRSILLKYGHSKLKKRLKYMRDLRKSITLEKKKY